MPRVAAAFFAVGVLYIFCGGGLGLWFTHGGNAALVGAHVHLNLVGWATMGLCGSFFALTKDSYSPRLAWTAFVILTAGILVFFPAFILFLLQNANPKFEPFMHAGNGLTGLGMLVFGVSVFRELFRAR